MNFDDCGGVSMPAIYIQTCVYEERCSDWASVQVEEAAQNGLMRSSYEGHYDALDEQMSSGTG